MRNIIKVASLENLPSTRPLIALDNNGKLFAEGEATGPTIEMVDLGLSVKWAKCNLGAQTETDYGDYYAWGEVETKNDYSFATYTRHSDGLFNYPSHKNSFYKYIPSSKTEYVANGYSADNKLNLDRGPDGDDIVNKLYGGNYRIPTEAECEELLNTTKVTSVWVTDYKGSGINGREFTSLINGNKLFIPAAGYYDGSSLMKTGSNGYCWTSKISTSSPQGSRYLYFRPNYMNSEARCCGFSIRPVL